MRHLTRCCSCIEQTEFRLADVSAEPFPERIEQPGARALKITTEDGFEQVVDPVCGLVFLLAFAEDRKSDLPAFGRRLRQVGAQLIFRRLRVRQIRHRRDLALDPSPRVVLDHTERNDVAQCPERRLLGEGHHDRHFSASHEVAVWCCEVRGALELCGRVFLGFARVHLRERRRLECFRRFGCVEVDGLSLPEVMGCLDRVAAAHLRIDPHLLVVVADQERVLAARAHPELQRIRNALGESRAPDCVADVMVLDNVHQSIVSHPIQLGVRLLFGADGD